MLKLMYAALIRASESWRGVHVKPSEFKLMARAILPEEALTEATDSDAGVASDVARAARCRAMPRSAAPVAAGT